MACIRAAAMMLPGGGGVQDAARAEALLTEVCERGEVLGCAFLAEQWSLGVGAPPAGRAREISLADGRPWSVPAQLHLGAVKEYDDRQFRDRTYSPGDLGCPANGGKAGPAWAAPGVSPSFPSETA